MTEKNIRSLHQPEKAYRMARREYPAGGFAATSRAQTLYVLAGTYRFRRGSDTNEWHEIPEGYYAHIPEGSFMVEIMDPRGAQIFYAIEIPEHFRPKD